MSLESQGPKRRVIPQEEWYGIMERLEKEGKLLPNDDEDDDLAIWDETVGDGLEDEEVWWD